MTVKILFILLQMYSEKLKYILLIKYITHKGKKKKKKKKR